MSHVHRTPHFKIPFQGQGQIRKNASSKSLKVTNVFTAVHETQAPEPLDWSMKKSMKLKRILNERMRQEPIRKARDQKYSCAQEDFEQIREVIVPKVIVPDVFEDCEDNSEASFDVSDLNEIFSDFESDEVLKTECEFMYRKYFV